MRFATLVDKKRGVRDDIKLENCQSRYRSNTWMGRTRAGGPNEFEPSKFDCIIISLIQHFVADFPWKVSLKILNLGLILKTFTHAEREKCSKF